MMLQTYSLQLQYLRAEYLLSVICGTLNSHFHLLFHSWEMCYPYIKCSPYKAPLMQKIADYGANLIAVFCIRTRVDIKSLQFLSLEEGPC